MSRGRKACVICMSVKTSIPKHRSTYNSVTILSSHKNLIISIFTWETSHMNSCSKKWITGQPFTLYLQAKMKSFTKCYTIDFTFIMYLMWQKSAQCRLRGLFRLNNYLPCSNYALLYRSVEFETQLISRFFTHNIIIDVAVILLVSSDFFILIL